MSDFESGLKELVNHSDSKGSSENESVKFGRPQCGHIPEQDELKGFHTSRERHQDILHDTKHHIHNTEFHVGSIPPTLNKQHTYRLDLVLCLRQVTEENNLERDN